MAGQRKGRDNQDVQRDAQSGTRPRDVPRDANAAARVVQALRLRRLGHTYDAIARQCGYANESGARKAIKKANASIIRDEARALVAWQLDRIDLALSVVLARIADNDKGSLWAVDRLVPLLKRQSELMGLDAEKGEGSAQPVIREYRGVPVEAV